MTLSWGCPCGHAGSPKSGPVPCHRLPRGSILYTTRASRRGEGRDQVLWTSELPGQSCWSSSTMHQLGICTWPPTLARSHYEGPPRLLSSHLSQVLIYKQPPSPSVWHGIAPQPASITERSGHAGGEAQVVFGGHNTAGCRDHSTPPGDSAGSGLLCSAQPSRSLEFPSQAMACWGLCRNSPHPKPEPSPVGGGRQLENIPIPSDPAPRGPGRKQGAEERRTKALNLLAQPAFSS